ncbi:MAG TPA: methyltransferase domain-containing protein [Chitinophagaceae bacterium]|nr:methyltransferase domain-containing protein [Chitinophagaceae bacterium]
MSDLAWYKDWFNSPFYHKLYFERDVKEAAAFISKLIDHLKPVPGSNMLDVACGRGRHSRLLAEKGFVVTGIDISPESIAFAKKFENDRLEFFQHDMRLPFRVNYFRYAFNFFTSFGYFKTRREHDDAIRTIANGLKPGGIFVIDYLNVHYSEDHLVLHEEKKINGTDYEIRRWHDETHFYKKIRISDPLLMDPLEYTEKVSKFSFGDFNDMLSYHGLQLQEAFGDYQLGSYHVRTKPRLIIVAQKKSK